MNDSWIPDNLPQVTIPDPSKYTPWDHQYGMWEYFQEGGLRGVCVWHRRAGKDISALNLLGSKSMERTGLYWHLFPTYEQGRKIAWDGMTSDGDRFIDMFPPELIAGVNNTQMKVTLRGSSLDNTGSIYQIVGTDDIDRLVGTNPVGCIFSEWSLMNPAVWDFIEPILLANGGWALFIYTPRGRNHGYDLYEMAKKNPNWYCELLTIDNTHKPDGTPIISHEQINELRAQGVAEEIIQQEYFCSFDASLVGAYYGQQMRRARAEGRIRKVPYDPYAPVHTFWDIGMDDQTAIWYMQEIGSEIHWIDYDEGSGEGLDYWAGVLNDKEWKANYGQHWAPHDIKVREWGNAGKSRWETARRLGILFRIQPKVNFMERVNAGRQILTISWFDEDKCELGLRRLNEYTKEKDKKTGLYKMTPADNGAQHGTDSFGGGAYVYRNKALRPKSDIMTVQARTDYDIFNY